MNLFLFILYLLREHSVLRRIPRVTPAALLLQPRLLVVLSCEILGRQDAAIVAGDIRSLSRSRTSRRANVLLHPFFLFEEKCAPPFPLTPPPNRPVSLHSMVHEQDDIYRLPRNIVLSDTYVSLVRHYREYAANNLAKRCARGMGNARFGAVSASSEPALALFPQLAADPALMMVRGAFYFAPFIGRVLILYINGFEFALVQSFFCPLLRRNNPSLVRRHRD